jgi:hypothetical protein
MDGTRANADLSLIATLKVSRELRPYESVLREMGEISANDRALPI